jgi:hypothetical protein
MSYIDSILVIPAQEEIHFFNYMVPCFRMDGVWIPAFAGITKPRTFFMQLSIAKIFLKIHPFVKGPFCQFCCNNIEHHNHTDHQKNRDWQRLKS